MFSIDTSGFLDAWTRYYPADVFPSLWAQMEGAARTGLIKASEEVVNELQKKDDGACKWIKDRPAMIVPTDEAVQREVARILAAYPRLVNAGKSRSGGDPFVVAVARLFGWSVITGETPSGKPQNPKIPDVCSALTIPCVNILQFFRSQNWKV